MPVVPGSLDQDAPDVRVSGLGDVPSPRLGPAGDLGRSEPDEGHQLTWVPEATEVPDLGQQHHGAEDGDPPQAGQALGGVPVGLALGHVLDLPLELGTSLEQVMDLDLVVLEGLLLDPPPVAVGPACAGAVDTSMPQEELAHPVPGHDQIPADVLACTDQVAHGLLPLVRHVDPRQLASAVEVGQLARVTTVGLDPVAGFLGDERGRDDVAVDAHAAELSVRLETARASLVAAAYVRGLCELLERLPDCLGVVGDDPLLGSTPPRRQDCYRDAVGVDIHAHVGDRLSHGRLSLRLRLCLRLIAPTTG